MTTAVPRLLIWMFTAIACPNLCIAQADDRLSKAVEQWWETAPAASSVVVRLDDAVVYEGYRNGQSSNDLMPVFSITKSIGAILTGIAQREGALGSLDTPVVEFLRQERQDIDATKQAITVRHVLTMSTGLKSNWSLEGRPIQAYRGDLDKAAFALDQDFDPGEVSRYSTLIANLVVPVIETSVGQDLEEYARSRLFRPLGIENWSWHTDDTGRKTIGAGLRMRTTDLTKIGQLLLDDGVYDGKRVLDDTFVEEATSSLVQIELPNGDRTGYGFLFWQSSSFPYRHFIASGYAGQMIFVVPDFDLVVAVSAPCCSATGASSERLVTSYVVPLLDNE